MSDDIVSVNQYSPGFVQPSFCLDILLKTSEYNTASGSALIAFINAVLSLALKSGILKPALSHR